MQLESRLPNRKHHDRRNDFSWFTSISSNVWLASMHWCVFGYAVYLGGSCARAKEPAGQAFAMLVVLVTSSVEQVKLQG